MPKRRELLELWSFPHIPHYGVTLVARCDATTCLERIYSESCNFYGYDAFTLFTDNTIQPDMKYSDSWTQESKPSLQVLITQIQNHPEDITHYEFVFNNDNS